MLYFGGILVKKIIALLMLCLLLPLAGLSEQEAALTGNAQLLYDAVRWNVNLPKQSNVIHAEEYLYKLTKEITLHAILAEVTISEEQEMMYGRGAHFILIDLDTGEIIDYKNFDGNVRWPDTGDVTSVYDALHLLYNGYWAYCEGYNEFIMGEHEFVFPMTEADVEQINAELNVVFLR